MAWFCQERDTTRHSEVAVTRALLSHNNKIATRQSLSAATWRLAAENQITFSRALCHVGLVGFAVIAVNTQKVHTRQQHPVTAAADARDNAFQRVTVTSAADVSQRYIGHLWFNISELVTARLGSASSPMTQLPLWVFWLFIRQSVTRCPLMLLLNATATATHRLHTVSVSKTAHCCFCWTYCIKRQLTTLMNTYIHKWTKCRPQSAIRTSL